MTISVHEAQIRTASVEIKTLSVSGKQVTLALFRQLLREHLYDDETMSVNGVPWGTINYHPDKCGDEARHHHVVWQKGFELRRAHVPDPAPEPLWHSAFAEQWLDSALAEGWTPQEWPSITRLTWHGLSVSFRGRAVGIVPGEEAKQVLLSQGARGTALLKAAVTRTSAELQELVLDDLDAQAARWRWRKECWASLALLPQLFIAV